MTHHGIWVCVCVYLSQQHYPLAIGPDDMVHLRAHSLPGQLRSPQARLQGEHNTIDNHLPESICFLISIRNQRSPIFIY